MPLLPDVFPPARALARWMPLLGAVAVLAACSKAAPAPEPVRAVRTQTIASDSAGATLEYAAEVRARVESRLGFRVGGKVTRRSVDLGDSVRAGQVLAQIDPQDLRLGQESAQAALAAAQANHVQARADFERYKELRAQGFIGAAELERRETTLKSAQATLDQAKAQAAVQGNQAAYAALVADAPGVITAVEAEPGQVVAAGTPIVRLAHDGPRDVVFSVPEDKQALIRPLEGKAGALRVKLWGSDTLLPATVREVAAAADPATRTFLVKADLGKVDVRLGQTATVLLDTPRISGVVKLPLSAVFEHQGESAVWRLDPQQMTVQVQKVQVAGAEGNLALIAAGVAPGQEIVTAGVHVLTPGQQVKRYGVAAPAASSAAVASH